MAAFPRRGLVGQPAWHVRCGFIALLVLTPLLFSPTTYRFFAPAKRACFIALAGLLVIADRSYLISRLKGILKDPAEQALAGFLGYLVLSAAWSSAPGEAVSCAVSIVSWFLLYHLVCHHFIYPRHTNLLFDALGISLLVNGVVACSQLFDVWVPTGLFASDAPIGWIGNKNWLAVFFAALLPLELWILRRRQSRLRRLIAGLNLVAGVPVLIMTFCRAAWGAFAFTIIIWFMLRAWGANVPLLRRRFTWLSVGVIAMFLALVLISMFAGETLISLWGGLKQQTLDARILSWQIAWRGIEDKPIVGHGLGSFGSDYTLLQEQYFHDFPERSVGRKWLLARPFRHAHNDIIEVVFEGGIIAALLLLVTLRLTIRRFFYEAQRIPVGDDRKLSHLLFALTVGLCIGSLASFPFRQTTGALLFIVFLGGLQRDLSGGRSHVQVASAYQTLVCLILGFALVSFAGLDFMSMHFHGRSLAELSRGNIAEARKGFEVSLAYNPLNGRAWHAIARCHMAAGDFEEARQCYDKGASQYLDRTYQHNLGVLELARRNPNAAVGHLTRAVRQCPDALALTALARVCNDANRLPEAERYYLMALDANRGCHEAAFALVQLQVKGGRGHEAVALLLDNIKVIDFRRAEGQGSVEDTVFLVKNLDSLSGLAESLELVDIAEEARKRLSAYRQ